MFKQKGNRQYILTCLDGKNWNLLASTCYRQIEIEGTEQNYEISHDNLVAEIENS